jgi:hypothetical protein
MKSATAVKAVLSALRVGTNELSLAAVNFNFTLLKEFQFEACDLKLAGFILADLQAAGFNSRELKAGGYDVEYDFEPQELVAMLRFNKQSNIACNSVKEMCINICKGSTGAKAYIQEAVSKGLLLLLFTRAAQACKAIDAKMDVGEDGLSEAASEIIDAQSVCDAISALASLEIFEERTMMRLPDALKLCRLASAVCSLWCNCHYTDADRKNYFVHVIMNMALSITQALIFYETHPANADEMKWEHRAEIYQETLSDKQFIRSLLMVCNAKCRTPWASIASQVMRNGTNVIEFCNRYSILAKIHSIATASFCFHIIFIVSRIACAVLETPVFKVLNTCSIASAAPVTQLMRFKTLC